MDIEDQKYQRLSQLFNRLPNGIILYKVLCNETDMPWDFRGIYANLKSEDIFGLPVDRILNSNLSELDADFRLLLEHCRLAANNRQSISFSWERNYAAYNGFSAAARWIDVHIELLDEDLFCSFTDATTYKQAELEAHRNAAALQFVLDSTQSGVILYRPVYDGKKHITDFEMLASNQEASGAFLSDQFVQTFLPDGNRSELYPIFKEVVETGRFRRFERHFQWQETEVWYEVTASRTYEKSNASNLLRLTFIDITKRKKAEQEKFKNLILLQQTEDLANAGSWEFNRTTGIHTWSPGMYRLFGLTPGTEVTPDIYTSLAIEEDRDIANRIVNQMRHGMQAFEEVLTVKVGDSKKIIKVKGEAVNMEKDVTVCSLGVDLDITQLIETQNRITRIADNLQAVLNSSPAFIGMLKAIHHPGDHAEIVDFELVVGNQKLAEFYNMPLPQLVGMRVSNLAGKLWQEKTVNNMRSVYLSRETMYIEYQIISENGEDQWLAVSITRQQEGVILTGLDITTLKHGQEQWLQQLEQSDTNLKSLDELKEYLKQRGELLRATSHDLRGNFGAIASLASLLMMSSSDEDRAKMLGMLQSTITQTTKMLTDLLNYARLESGKEARNIGIFNASEVLTNLGESIRPFASERNLDVRINENPEITVEGDELNVLRIAQNLLLNAIKYTESGFVELSWGFGETKEFWWFRVKDSGPGFPEAFVKEWDQHKNGQLASSPVRNAENELPDPNISWTPLHGEGIGLRIVRQLGQLLGANIVLKSSPGAGSEFTVTLPAKY
ncbi:PAS domain-containing protein [Dyadobacter flavalbus]|uniref:histidine kinase n=1 Tax=Dyadobacter flavalbus TaxID=2579942 RepID=A0A5M8QRB1_9BACT|nr:PAS domain-containing sensor histidine kinase [Dyadobacter flavalbus]KAA6437033.1 PAS domain-containing protein [Dyadobacter flavalbus]